MGLAMGLVVSGDKGMIYEVQIDSMPTCKGSKGLEPS